MKSTLIPGLIALTATLLATATNLHRRTRRNP